MNIKMLLLALSALFVAPIVLAHGDEKHETMPAMESGRDIAKAMLHVDPGAVDAIAAVERFSNALSAGDVAKVAAELDPRALILESGGAERSSAQYLGGHVNSDAAFLKSARVTLKHRTAQASGDLAWVASESEIHAMKGEEMLMIESTETIVLRRTAKVWKIVHIHWSSRSAGDQ